MYGIELPYPWLDRRGPLANAAGPKVPQERINRRPGAAACGFEMFTQETSTGDKLPARLRSAAFVSGQCVIDVSFGKLIGQRAGVLCGFGDTGADMRARHESRVAHQHDTTERHARSFEIKDGGKNRLLNAGDQFGKLRRQQCAGARA